MLKLNKFSILNILAATFSSFWNFLGQWKVTGYYAVVLTVLTSVIGNWSYSCGSLDNFWWCHEITKNPYKGFAVMLFYFAAFIGLIFAFMYDLYAVSYKNNYFSARNIFSFSRPKTKFVLSGIFFFFGMIFSFIISLWFINSPANPDWHIEALKFLFVFSTGVMFLISLKLSALIGGFLQESKYPKILALLKQTSGKGYIVLICFCLVLFLMMMLFVNFSFVIKYFTLKYPLFIVAVCGEFIGNYIKLILAGIFAAFCCAQYKILDTVSNPKTENQAAENNVAEIIKAKPAESNKKKRSVNKKTSQKTKRKTTVRKKQD